MPIPARENHTQQQNYLRATINFNTPGAAAGIPIGTLPAGARINDIVAYVDTAFNAATTNTVAVGTTGTGAQIATSTDIGPGAVGAKRITTGLAQQFAQDTTLYMSYVQAGTAATAGSATVMIFFVPNNDR